MIAERHPLAPATNLATAHFVAAHLALVVALAGLVAEPALPWALDSRPRLTALLHLVTLGWISGSILGALYLVTPLAFARPLRATMADRVAYVAYWGGVCGVAAAFWTGNFGGLPVAAAFVLSAVVVVGARTMRALWRAPLPAAIPLHVGLAFANLVVAGGLGMVMALGRGGGAPPGVVMPLVEAHAHLAVLGWTVMMIFGVGYRLLPMVLPTAMPRGRSLVASALLLEAGTLGLCSALARAGDLRPWAALIGAAFVAFFAHVVRMLANPRPRPVDLPVPDWSTRQTAFALSYGLVAVGLGGWLAATTAPAGVRWAYAVSGLLGFASQLIVGIQGRLVPLQAWFRAMERRKAPPTISAHVLVTPWLAASVCLLWQCGLPALTAGLVGARAPLVGAGAALLLVATLAHAWHGWTMFARAARAEASNRRP